MNVRKAFTFRGYNYETDSSDSEHYYKFVPSTTDYYEVNVDNFIENNTSIVVYDSRGKDLDYGEWNQFTNFCKTDGVKLIAGNTYYIRIYKYIEEETARPVYTTVVKHLHSYTLEYEEGAGCTEAGYERYSCSTCYDEYTKTIPTIGHKYVLTDSKEASCTETGNKEYACKNCGDSYEITIPKADHIWDKKYTIDEEPECITTGRKLIHCSNEDCDAVKSTVSIPATGHRFRLDIREKASDFDDGYEWYNCDNCGKEKFIRISRPKTITLSKSSYVYNNKVQKPTVTVKDSKGKGIESSNYTVSYVKGRKDVGSYKVTVKFKGKKYTGSLSKSFAIVPNTTTLKSVIAASKGFTAKWTKQATQTTGYELQYSTSSKFSDAKTVIITKNSAVSKKVTKLVAKKYYVRIRTYKTGSGKKYYSAWSKVKTVTTKK